MNIVNRYSYRPIRRMTRPDGVRHYIDPDSGALLPSVTTVLAATADRRALNNWIKRKGVAKAEEIREEAAHIGTLMHAHLDCHVTNQPRPRGNNHYRGLAQRMADVIIAHGMPRVSEVWGSEVALHARELYAGTTDLIGLFDDIPAVIDYKTARKLKRRNDPVVQDYLAQASAYSLSHNECFGTTISTCVLFMVDRDLQFELFISDGDDFNRAASRWEQRMITYYATHPVPAPPSHVAIA